MTITPHAPQQLATCPSCGAAPLDQRSCTCGDGAAVAPSLWDAPQAAHVDIAPPPPRWDDLSIPRRRPRAVSEDVTSLILVLAVVVVVLGGVSHALPYARVDGVELWWRDDPALLAGAVASLALTVIGAVSARMRSGVGIGLATGGAACLATLHLRTIAALMGDGTPDVVAQAGAWVLTVTGVAALVIVQASTGCLSGAGRSGRGHFLVIGPAAAMCAAVLAEDRAGLLRVSWELGTWARACASGALFLQLVVLVIAVLSRSYVGAAMLVAVGVVRITTALTDADAPDGVLVHTGAPAPGLAVLLGGMLVGVGVLLVAGAALRSALQRRRDRAT